MSRRCGRICSGDIQVYLMSMISCRSRISGRCGREKQDGSRVFAGFFSTWRTTPP
jgi:hypothetical protein